MAIAYPSWLPLAQRASKNMTTQTPFRSDQPAVGAPIFQKLTTDVAQRTKAGCDTVDRLGSRFHFAVEIFAALVDECYRLIAKR